MLSITPALSIAKWSNDPKANTPVCTVEGDQGRPKLATDGSGGGFIVWKDSRTSDGQVAGGFGQPGLYMQRLSASGASKLKKEGISVSPDLVVGFNYEILSDGAGGAFVAFSAYRGYYVLCVQHFSSAGKKLWGETGVDVRTSQRPFGTMSMVRDDSGGLIACWDEQRAHFNVWDIFGQRLNSAGDMLWEPTGIFVCVANDDQTGVQLVTDGSGGAIATWLDYRSGASSVFAQRIASSGVVLWPVGGVDSVVTGQSVFDPQLLDDGGGGAFLAVSVYSADTFDVVGQHLSSSGARMWGDHGTTLSIGDGSQAAGPSLVRDAADGIIVGWSEHSQGRDTLSVQRVNSQGSLLWGAGGITLFSNLVDANGLRIASDGAGGAIATWTEVFKLSSGANEDVFAQRIDKDGITRWPSSGIHVSAARSYQVSTVLCGDGKGGALLAWEDLRSAGTDTDIYAEHIVASGARRPNLIAEPVSLIENLKNCSSPNGCELTGTFRILNQGNSKSRKSQATFYLSNDTYQDASDLELATVQVKGLSPRAAQEISLQYTLVPRVDPAGQYLLMVADFSNNVPEQNESDNMLIFGPIP